MLRHNSEERLLQITGTQTNSFAFETNTSKKITNIPFLTEIAFLGCAQSFGQATASGRLSLKQIAAIQRLGIKVKPNTTYQYGIVNAETLSGHPIDIESLHQYIEARTAFIINNPQAPIAKETQLLMKGLQLCHNAKAALVNDRSDLPRLVLQEERIQLAQLGTTLLPQDTLRLMREPVHFVDTACVSLGRLIQNLIQD